MDTAERATVIQEGLPLTPAIREYAQRETRCRFIRYALFVAFGLIVFPLFFAILDLASEQGRARLGLFGALIWIVPLALWGLVAVALGRWVLSARRLASDGTYARYVGPFTVQRYESSEHLSGYLKFADRRVKLGDQTSVETSDVDVVGMYSSGVVDWLPNLQALTVWDDRGNCLFRVRHYGEDPNLPPPPARRPARRAWPEE